MKCSTTCADKTKLRIGLSFLPAQTILNEYIPTAFAIGVEIETFYVIVYCDAGHCLKLLKHLSRERTEVYVGTHVHACGGNGCFGIAASHNYWGPLSDLVAVLRPLHVAEQRARVHCVVAGFEILNIGI